MCLLYDFDNLRNSQSKRFITQALTVGKTLFQIHLLSLTSQAQPNSKETNFSYNWNCVTRTAFLGRYHKTKSFTKWRASLKGVGKSLNSFIWNHWVCNEKNAPSIVIRQAGIAIVLYYYVITLKDLFQYLLA